MSLLSAHQMKMTGAGYQSGADGEKESPVKSGGQFSFRDELLNRMYKILGVVDTTLQHLQIQGLLI